MDKAKLLSLLRSRDDILALLLQHLSEEEQKNARSAYLAEGNEVYKRLGRASFARDLIDFFDKKRKSPFN